MNALQRKNIRYSVFLIVLVLVVYSYRAYHNKETAFYLKGTTMGVVPYNVKYEDKEGRKLETEIANLLKEFNQSLSTYIKDSEISEFNRKDTLVFRSSFFYPVLKKSQEVWEKSGGAFDPTIMPLVTNWGFGPGKEKNPPDDKTIDSLQRLVGFEKVRFDKEKVWKSDPNSQIDFSAIAKGYAVDVVAEFLEGLNIVSYMVEIGGEVRCGGKKPTGDSWLIGIENPVKAEAGVSEAEVLVRLDDRSLATSGNYRNFYIADGKKYAHTLSPFTGYPVQHSLLSASVFADDCMTADAFATAFMVLGLEEAKGILQENAELDAILIYDLEGELQTFISEGLKPSIVQ